MSNEPNPYRDSTVPSALNGPTKKSASIFAKLTFLVTVVCTVLLVAAAIYNVSLWQDGAKPPHALSIKIMSSQVILAMILMGMTFFHFAAAPTLFIIRKPESAILSVVGFILSVFAIVFTMIYDQGSIFFQ